MSGPRCLFDQVSDFARQRAVCTALITGSRRISYGELDDRARRVGNGLHTLKREGLPAPDTPLGQALREWEASLVADLGGEDVISTQQRALIDMAVRTKLIVDSVDAFILSMPHGPVNRRDRRLFDVVLERGKLVRTLQSLLKDLGLERRRVKMVADLKTYIAQPSRPPGDPDDEDGAT